MGLLSLAAAAAIEAVVLEPGYGMGFNGSITVEYRPVVLYADGRYTTDAAGALKPAPRIDGRWQRSGSGWRLKGADGKTTELEAKLQARPAPPGTPLEGVYRSVGGVGAAGTGVAVVATAQSLAFGRDGTVREDRAAGTAVKAGRHQAAGRYRVEGWTLTITGDDGRADTRLLYLFPDGDGALGWGDATLSRRKGAP